MKKFARTLLWNTIGGLLILLIANLVWETSITWWAVALAAVGGVPGALLAILLDAFVV